MRRRLPARGSRRLNQASHPKFLPVMVVVRVASTVVGATVIPAAAIVPAAGDVDARAIVIGVVRSRIDGPIAIGIRVSVVGVHVTGADAEAKPRAARVAGVVTHVATTVMAVVMVTGAGSAGHQTEASKKDE